MTYADHVVVKPKVLLQAAAEGLKDKLIVSNLVTKRNDVDTFFAAEGDTISQRVKGTLPVRRYALRNDRSQPIITDTITDTVVSMTIEADRPYSAVKLTDEQLRWDFADGWGDIVDRQMDRLGGYLESGVLRQILAAPFERIVKVKNDTAGLAAAKEKDQDVWYNATVDATTALKKMRTPGDTLVALCGLDFADQLRKSNKLRKDQGLGGAALSSAAIGTLAGVNYVESTHVPSDEAYVFAKSGFVVFTGAAAVPKSVPYGATASVGGWALRHLMDYDTAFLTDRSVFDCFSGYSYTKDRLTIESETGAEFVSTNDYFVRGVRLVLADSSVAEKTPGDGKDDTPGGSPDSYLAKAYKQQLVSEPEQTGKPYPLGGNYPGEKLQAKATIESKSGKITEIAITTPGFGYTSTPDVTITGAGTGAAAVALISNGEVTAVVITNAGSGYTGEPTVVIEAP
ncbi:hypothetical protein [Arthrobacter sp. 31Y]|uniref:hypothetical protein n=1 Tax=Arthrobacter sp. 31Y TaxID=1115632 RepID=UPI0004674A1E|nr:hypothetical protein [Arthrobacter sp. 31Y]